jgi:signal transduction histidine kinase
MLADRLKVLLIEDNPDHVALIRRQLAGVRSTSIHVESADRLADGLERLRQGDFNAVLSDLELPDSKPEETLAALLAQAPGVPVIALTALDDVDVATASVQQGAQDYLVKTQITGDLIMRSIRYAIQRKHSEEQLKALNETLEQRVQERTAVAEQRAEQLRLLAADLSRTEQRERRRLAQVLHDHLQQLLVAAKMGLSALRGRVADSETLERIGSIENLIIESIDASRSLTFELSPPVLQQGKLREALAWLTEWMQDKHGLSVELQADESADSAPDDVRHLLFDIVRELLFNVVKHANVPEAAVELYPLNDGRVEIVVSDAGSGFDAAEHDRGTEATHGFGFFSILQRLQVLGGELEVDSAPGCGTRVTVRAPIVNPGPSPQTILQHNREPFKV